MKNNSKTKIHAGLLPYSLAIAMLWSLLIAISLIWNMKIEKTRTHDAASIEARTAFEKDIIYRRWNAENDGVYGLVSNKTQPNPYLNASERDIITPWGSISSTELTSLILFVLQTLLIFGRHEH